MEANLRNAHRQMATSPSVSKDTGPAKKPAYSSERLALALGSLATLAGIGLRWSHLDAWSLWWDEGFTAWAAGLSPARIIPFAKSDNQAPLYYLLQHYWDLSFGNSEFALRALSSCFGTLALVAFFLLARKILKDSLAVALAVWLFAFSLKQIWYSREARAYEAACFFGLLALYALVSYLEKRSLLAFAVIVVGSALTLYLHNMMAFYLLGLNAAWLIYPSDRGWLERMKEIAVADFCVGLLVLPWVLSLFTEVAQVSGNLYWVPKPTLHNLFETARDLAGFDMSYLALFSAKRVPLSMVLIEWLEGAGIAVLCVLSFLGGLVGVSREDRRKYAAMLSYGAVPILLVFLMSQASLRLYLDRVFTASSTVVPIIFALPLAAHRGRGRILWIATGAGVALAVALSGIGFVRYREATVRNGENWRGISATLHSIAQTNRLLVFTPPAGEIFFDYASPYFPKTSSEVMTTGVPGGFHEKFPPFKAKTVDRSDVERLKATIEANNYSEVDLVLTHDVDPNNLLSGYLNTRFVRQPELPPSNSKIHIIPFRLLPPAQ